VNLPFIPVEELTMTYLTMTALTIKINESRTTESSGTAVRFLAHTYEIVHEACHTVTACADDV
jgi:hypothetical protein